MSFLGGSGGGGSSSSHHNKRSHSPARSFVSTGTRAGGGGGAFVRAKSPSRHEHPSSRSRGAEPSFFGRAPSPHRSRSSPAGIGAMFGMGGGSSSHHRDGRGRTDSPSRDGRRGSPQPSMRGIFGGGKHSAGSSYYRRQPRQGFVQKIMTMIKRILRDLIRYAKRNPVKLVMLVVMPLITGGALTGLLARFGMKLPSALSGMMGGHQGQQHGGGGYYGSQGYGQQEGGGGIGGMLSGGGGGAGGLAGTGLGLKDALGVAKMFM